MGLAPQRDYEPTFGLKIVTKERDNIKLELYDTCSQERFKNFITLFLKDACIYIYCVDSSQNTDGNAIVNFMKGLPQYNPQYDPKKNPIIIVKTKFDKVTDEFSKQLSDTIDTYQTNYDARIIIMEDTDQKTADEISDTLFNLAKEFVSRPEPIKNTAQKQKIIYPSSYRKMFFGSNTLDFYDMTKKLMAPPSLQGPKKILADYTNNNWLRFHWNRHHTAPVKLILNDIGSKITKADDLIAELEKIPNRNPAGSLQKRIHYLKELMHDSMSVQYKDSLPNVAKKP